MPRPCFTQTDVRQRPPYPGVEGAVASKPVARTNRAGERLLHGIVRTVSVAVEKPDGNTKELRLPPPVQRLDLGKLDLHYIYLIHIGRKSFSHMGAVCKRPSMPAVAR